jgi:amino acid adenylation domain-containing protein
MEMENIILTDKRYQNEVRFWERKFASPDIISIRRSTQISEDPICVEIELLPQFTEFVTNVCHDDLGKFTLIMSLIAVILNKYKQSENLALLSPSLSSSQNKQIVPLFVNVSEHASLRSLVRHMKVLLEESYTHINIPIEYYLNKHFKTKFRNLTSIAVHCDSIHAAVMCLECPDLLINIDLKEKYKIRISCNPKSELVDIIPRIETHIHQVSRAFLNLDQSIAEIQIISENEIKQILCEFNPAAKYGLENCSMMDQFETQVRKTPHNLAFCSENESITFRELNHKSNLLAHYLMQRCEILPDQVIGIMTSRSMEMIIGMVAILKTGAAYLPIDPTYPNERIEYMIRDSGLKILLTESAYSAKLEKFDGLIFQMDKQLGQLPKCTSQITQASESHHLAYIIYTSGSTGRPKGVMIEQHSLLNLCSWHVANFDVNEKSRGTLYAGIGFDASTWEIWPYLLAGATLVPVPDSIRTDIQRLMRYFKEMRISHTFLPTKMAEEVIESDQEFPDLLILTGGEKLTVRKKRIKGFVNNYGPTESTVVATSRVLGGNDDEDGGNIGKPIANTQIYILDEQQKLLPVGVAGEICISGAGLARGYLNQPGLSADKFISSPFTPNQRLYRTGDLGKWLPDGSIYFVGRKDNQVKIRGHRIEKEEIEAVLQKNEAVKESVVEVVEDNKTGRFLVAYVTLHFQKQQTIAGLKQFLTERLPVYMVPSHIRILEKLPVTSNGKVDRRFLSDTANFRSTQDGMIIPPRNGIQIRLSRIWQEILDLEEVSIDGDFFELGGNSMNVARLVARIENEFNLTIPIASLFERPTVEKLSGFISGKEDSTRVSSCIVSLQPLGKKDPVFFIHPIDGDVTCYLNLAKCLGNDRPFYGLHYENHLALNDSIDTIEHISRRYIDAILKIEPYNAVHLGGWSFGGLVAFEMAYQLEQRGIRVGSLTLIDTTHPATCRVGNLTEAVLLKEFAKHSFATYRSDAVERWQMQSSNLESQQFLSEMLAMGKTLHVFPDNLQINQLEKYWKVFSNNCRAMNSYDPPVIQTPVNLFVCKEEGEPMLPASVFQWKDLCKGSLKTHIVEADHYAVIREPAIQDISKELTRILK